MHMLIYGLYGNNYGHLEKSMMLKLQLNCRIERNLCSQILGLILLFILHQLYTAAINSADFRINSFLL